MKAQKSRGGKRLEIEAVIGQNISHLPLSPPPPTGGDNYLKPACAAVCQTSCRHAPLSSARDTRLHFHADAALGTDRITTYRGQLCQGVTSRINSPCLTF